MYKITVKGKAETEYKNLAELDGIEVLWAINYY